MGSIRPRRVGPGAAVLNLLDEEQSTAAAVVELRRPVLDPELRLGAAPPGAQQKESSRSSCRV